MQKNNVILFIEDAIKGGWKQEEIERCTIHFVHENANDGAKNCLVIDNSYTDSVTGIRHNIAKHYSIGDILLDPLAWQAVGKTRGWEDVIDWTPLASVHCARCGDEVSMGTQRTWKYNIHLFIDHLAEGDDIDTALGKLQE